MWSYEKRLQFPVNITRTCPKTARLIISQYGGPDGELSASLRYLSQRYTMPLKSVGGLLTDIGTEELAHMEMICAIVYQLTKDLSPEEIERSDHRTVAPDGSRPALFRGGIPVQGGRRHGPDGEPGCGAEGQGGVREPSAGDPGTRCAGTLKIPAGPGDRPFPALRRGPGADEGEAGCQELLLFQSGI